VTEGVPAAALGTTQPMEEPYPIGASFYFEVSMEVDAWMLPSSETFFSVGSKQKGSERVGNTYDGLPAVRRSNSYLRLR